MGRSHKPSLNHPAASAALLAGLGTPHWGHPSSLYQGQALPQYAESPHLAAVAVLACHSSLAEALASSGMARVSPAR